MLRRRTRYRIGTAIFVAVLVSFAFFAAYSGLSLREGLLSQAVHQTNEAPAAQDCAAELKAKPWHGGDVALALAYIACALETVGAKEDSPEKTAREKSDVEAQWEMAKWAAWMVAMTFTQVLVGGVGIYYIRRSLKENRRGIAAANRGAKAAQTAIRVAQDTAKRELRAYVTLEIKSREWPPDEPDRHDIYLRVVNEGKTWAREVRVEQHRIPLLRVSSADPFIAATWSPNAPPSMILGPGQHMNLQFGAIDYATVGILADSDTAFHYVARVTYRDAVSGDTMWQTQASHRLMTDTQGGISFQYNGTHNCADDDCPEDVTTQRRRDPAPPTPLP